MIGKLKWVMLAVIAVFLLGWVIQPAYALNVKVKVIADGLQSPVDLKEAPDGSGRLFIVEQTGTIRVVMPDGTMRPEAFLDLRASIVKQIVRFDERGTLGLAFHPKYKSNGKFYVHYSAPIVLEVEGLRHEIFGNHTTYVSEFKVSDNPNIADPKSERVLLKVAQPQFNHNGGSMNFGPDGYLYISLGDGGFADDWGYGHNKKTGNAQDLSNLLGKILRIDVNSKSMGKEYGIPKDNPFVDKKGAQPEIFAYGFRNPWRMTFDTGGKRQLFVADVQQNSYEEVNIVTKGGNYGWRVLEGNHCFDYLNPNDHLSSCNKSGKIAPIIEYNHCNKFGGKNCFGVNVQGGAVYRGSHSAWKGKYFFGDWSMTFGGKSGRIYAATNKGGKWSFERANVTNSPFITHVLAVTQDLKGNVYAMTTESLGPFGSRDKVYQIVP
ncbi:MAG: PQQ-dependent sugar dehydrogenase [SAR324 cluster bacterium]|nr:PQQ-dependent sugar dehydrogenase [SAR324 cluster bacterium]